MGLFSFIKSAAVEANNEVHGKRLLASVHATFEEINSLNGQLQYVAMTGYVQIRERLLAEISNFTQEGQIQLGRKMQDQALRARDMDRAGSYAKWLGGAWLECFGRLMQTSQSMEAFKLLNDFAEYIKNDPFGDEERASKSDSTERESDVECYRDLDTLDFDQWLLAFKRIAANYNNGLALDSSNRSLIDYMDVSLLREAFDDGLNPEDVAPAFARQFDLQKFGGRR